MMAIEQKMRSLYCGLPAGLDFVSLDEMNILPLDHIPFEMQLIVARWIEALPQSGPDQTSESLVVSDNSEYGLALTEGGWSAFVTWMLQTLENEQRKTDYSKISFQNSSDT